MEIPRIALGTFKLGDDESINEPIRFALEDAGYRHVDCAEFYLNEQAVGNALEKVFSNGKVKREEVWITSKVWNHHHRREEVLKACKRTLANLKLEYLDLYLIHWPVAFVHTENDDPVPKDSEGRVLIDTDCSIIETWLAMEELVSLGLVKHIGVSNFTIELLEKLRFEERVHVQPYCNQVEVNLYMQQEALRRYCEFRDIFIEAYAPLGTGHWKEDGMPNLLADPVLTEISKETGKPVGSVELRFLSQLSPKMVVLVKSKTPERIVSNIDQSLTLTDEQMERLRKCERCTRYVNPQKTWGTYLYGDAY
ncbi:Aldose reductase [Tritrichomonas foetus]|uniref:Aldose reductase n=1 Tax=Tritrichomonas foetus TaxID=1144522 RepID=A0A1J4JIW3_9EUKA|nr:Aldose reductase [Tritrichomonas foetus]|eukprot:OHS98295.1 Aldose reductase [Tritrichomonas foetus]